jgi:hypothetical protein
MDNEKQPPKKSFDVDALLAGLMKDGHLLSNSSMIYKALSYSIINQVMLTTLLREIVALRIQVEGGTADAQTVDHRLYEIRAKLTDEVNAKIAKVTADIAAETKDHFPEDFPGSPNP